MLVLERKPNEAILLTRGEEQITVTVTRVQGGKVRIGIEAGDDWTIRRIDNTNTKESRDASTDAVDQVGN
jgi:carbon storage regulator CsrA